MSSYWDAVTRAATGAPGEAGPRPRSMFESDGLGEDFGVDGLEGFDQEIEAPQPSTPIAPAAWRGSAMESPPAGEDTPVAATPLMPPPPPQRAESLAGAAEQAPQASPAEPVTAAPLASTAAPPPAPPASTAAEPARVVERLETVRTVVEPAQAVATPVAEAAPPPTPPAAEPVQHAQARGAALDAEPTFAMAQPLEIHREAEVRSHAPEAPAPLVIEIDRIEVRIVSDAAAPAPSPRRREAAATLSLNDYLARRGP